MKAFWASAMERQGLEQLTPETRLESPLRMLLRSRLMTALQGIGLLLFSGSLGYWVLGRLHWLGLLEPELEEPWSVLDCVYMTVITVSTIGYGETFPLDEMPIVRLFTIGLILTGMILVAYSVSSATAFFVNGDLQRLLMRRRNMKQIARLEGHYIVCGFGVTGQVILDELIETGQTVVVIDQKETKLSELRERKKVLTVQGDATTDEILLEAGLMRASGLAAALPSDKDNLFLIVSVRQLTTTVRIVSSASEEAVQKKLLRAGADAVVSSSFIGGLRLASELLRPAVVSFLDLMLRQSDAAVRFAEVEIGPEWNGKSVADLSAKDESGLPVLALQPPGSEVFTFNPGEDHVLSTGMKLVTMGSVERVKTLDRLVGQPDTATFAGPGADEAGNSESPVASDSEQESGDDL